jgi:hypothetical protein
MEKHALRIFESREPGRALRTTSKMVRGGWKKLHNEKLCNSKIP